MKRLFTLALVFCLAVGGIAPARAAEVAEPTPPMESESVTPMETEVAPVTVATLEELQAAIDAAEDGATIAISSEIRLQNLTLDTPKDIVLVRADNFTSFIFLVEGACRLSGMTFVDNQSKSAMMLIQCSPNGGEVIIENCSFVGDGNWNSYMINIFDGSVTVRNCIFENSEGSAISTSSFAEVKVDGRKFFNNSALGQGGAICNSGNLTLTNSVIQENRASIGGGIYNAEGAKLSVRNCEISGNTTDEKFYGSDILSLGLLDIDREQDSSAGFYEETTGEKITLPLSDCTTVKKLVYLEDEAAREYFAIEWTPIEPAPIIPATQLEPSQKPDNGGEDTDDDYTPPEDYRPSHKPAKPSKPVDTIPMEEIKSAPVLACGGAVIDTSRSVVLAGYGDGLLHEEDPLTRAQLAVIIYRLLDDETIDRYQRGTNRFDDVPADTWCNTAITTIANAKIVVGIGNDLYAPNDLVTWAQVLTVLSRFVEAKEVTLHSIEYDGWALQAVKTAVAMGWIEDSVAFDPGVAITRGQLVEVFNSILSAYRFTV